MSNPFTQKDALADVVAQVMLGEKKLTDAEKKKREEIAQAMERENPGMDMGKKMAIATAQAKKVAEEAELDEQDFSNEKAVRNRVTRANDDHEYSIGVADEKRKEGLYDPRAIARLKKTDKAADSAHSSIKKTAVASFIKNRKGDGKVRTEEVDQIDEISADTLQKYRVKAKSQSNADYQKVRAYPFSSDKGKPGKGREMFDLMKKVNKRIKGVDKASIKLGKTRFDEQAEQEDLETFLEEYTTMFNEAEDTQQLMLLRAMAQDPSELMKMKRALKAGDKAMTNPVLRVEILKMLDQMMNLTTTDKSLLQKTRMGFQKAKTMKMPEEVQIGDTNGVELEEGFTHYRYSGHVNGKDYEVHIPRKHDLGDYSDHQLHKKISRENPHLHHHEVTAIVDSGGEEDSHVEVEHKGQKHKHHVYNEQEPDYVYEEVEQIDELSKKTLGSYIKKATYNAQTPNKNPKSNTLVHAALRARPEPMGGTERPYGAKKHVTAIHKRVKGIETAADKLTREEVQLEAIGAKDKQDEGEYGYEGDMAMSQLRTIIRNCEEMMKVLDKETDLPEWVQSKITLATDYLQTANDYLMSELEEAVRIRDRSRGFEKEVKYAGRTFGIDRHGDDKTTFQGQMDRKHLAAAAKARRARTGSGVKGFNSAMKPAKKGDYQPQETGSVRARNEEVDKDAPFEGGREVKSSKTASDRVKKIAKGMQKRYTKDKK